MREPGEILGGWEHRKRTVAIGATVLLAIGAIFDSARFFQAYLFAYLFILGLALGSLGIYMLHNLTGGGWGVPIRRILEAGIRTLPLLALLFLPLVIGTWSLYEWTHGETVARDPILQHKQAWLNVPFFLLRTALYFAVWLGLGRSLLRLTERYEATGDEAVRDRRTTISAGGILAYVVTMTFAAFDWGMSLEAHWFSTIYGLHFVIGQVLSAFAMGILGASWLWKFETVSEGWTKDQLNDLGNLLLAFLMLWAYVAFSQFLIIWSGNLPEETPWYEHRIHGGWEAVALLLVFFHFALPFLFLLSQRNKRSPRALLLLAVVLLAVHVLDMFWIITPAFHAHGVPFPWAEFLALAAVGGIWAWQFLRHLRSRPLFFRPPPAPGLKEAPAS